MALELFIEATHGAARVGRVSSNRGSFRIPCFMPVGTRGTVKTLDSSDLAGAGVEVILSNTYHLMLRPGVQTVRHLGGLHAFMGWEGHVLTDSGGFQVYSLGPEVDDEGVTFRSVYDGSLVRLTPEGALETQMMLGSDIAMVLDVCCALPAPRDVVELALERSVSWARRCVEHRRRMEGSGEWAGSNSQALFGIVQGGTEPDLRVQSAQRTVELGFDGYGIGGLSVGEPRNEMLAMVEATTAHLPQDKPRYLMGVGDPVSVLEAVARGVDMFDCVAPTRAARHGTAWTWAGKLALRAASSSCDPSPIDPDCKCPVCSRWSRGYIRHLLQVGEPTGARLTSIHNVHFMASLIEAAGQAVASGDLESLCKKVAAAWDRPGKSTSASASGRRSPRGARGGARGL